MSEICFNRDECLFLIYIICNFDIFTTVIQDCRQNGKKILFIGDILQFFLKKIITFLLLDVSTSLSMYHASGLFIIKDILDIYTQQKQNNECMLITTCLQSKTADVI